MQMLPEVKPLATIDYKGTTWPVAWTWTYGQGKVFHTSLAHKGYKPGTYDPLTNPNLMKLIIQGIDYAAGKPGS
jgi:type 1 glutamine amidotransferase